MSSSASSELPPGSSTNASCSPADGCTSCFASIRTAYQTCVRQSTDFDLNNGKNRPTFSEQLSHHRAPPQRPLPSPFEPRARLRASGRDPVQRSELFSHV